LRITDKVLMNTYLGDLNGNLQKMLKYDEQLSSGKAFRRPSDDPFRVSRSIDLNSSINRNEQYSRNINEAKTWLNTTDEALGQVGESIQKLRGIVSAAANSQNSKDELLAYKSQALQIIDGMADIGNGNFNGKYIFAGLDTTNPPIKCDNTTGMITAGGNDGDVNIEISPLVKIKINITGTQVFNKDFTDSMQRIVGYLSEEGHEKELSGELENLDKAGNNVLNLRAEVGAKVNRMEFAEKKNGEETFNMTEIMSKNEDIDYAEKYMEFKVAEAVYQGSLMVGAKILQPSLLDFLR
jgi:flagellar hook-associated protein 3 FlgL